MTSLVNTVNFKNPNAFVKPPWPTYPLKCRIVTKTIDTAHKEILIWFVPTYLL